MVVGCVVRGAGVVGGVVARGLDCPVNKMTVLKLTTRIIDRLHKNMIDITRIIVSSLM